MADYITDEVKEEIRNLSITAVAELMGAVQKKKKFLCYNGHDTEPSLNVSEKKGLYYCFGCGEGGDIIKLVMNAKKIDYIAACRLLMAEYGIQTGQSQKNRTFRKPNTRSKLPVLIKETDTSRYRIYEWLISRLNLTAIGLNYLTQERGFSEQIVHFLDIRDMVDPKHFAISLRAHFTDAELLASGLFIESNYGLSMVWRDHVIIFPFLDENLRIVNLQARRLNPDGLKYVFLKGIESSLYNLSILNEIDRGDRLLLCEGVPDTITALILGHHAIGVPGAHAFKEEFVDLLIDYEIYVLPDRDDAGQKFVKKVKDAFKLRGTSIHEFKVPTGYKDLNEYFNRTHR